MSDVTTFNDVGGYAATGKQHAIMPCPTASDVLTAWAANPPPGMLVESSGEHRDELQYKTVEGVQKWAKRKDIQGAINGLLAE